MKTSEFHMKQTKIMNILKFPCDNYENHENLTIQRENHENAVNLRIQWENNENQ